MASSSSSSRLSRRGLLAGAALALISTRISAQAASNLADIVERGTLRIAMPDIDSVPFFTRSQDDEHTGLDVEMARQIAVALQVTPSFVTTGNTFDEAVELIATSQADLAICKLSRTLRRGRIILYSEPYAVLHHGLIANRLRLAGISEGRSTNDVVRDFQGVLGIIAHSSFVEYAPQTFPRARLREFSDWNSMIDAVRAGSIDMAYRDDFEIKKLLVDDPSLTVVARSITLTDKTDTIAIGVRPDAPHLVSFVNLFLDLARGGTTMKTDEIIDRYRAEKAA